MLRVHAVATLSSAAIGHAMPPDDLNCSLHLALFVFHQLDGFFTYHDDDDLPRKTTNQKNVGKKVHP
jgi:hypothetical protein